MEEKHDMPECCGASAKSESCCQDSNDVRLMNFQEYKDGTS